MSAVVEANAKGDKFQNITVAMAGYAPEAAYRKAEALYNTIHQGGVVINQDFEDSGEHTVDTSEF
jgi:hypothetical protein